MRTHNEASANDAVPQDTAQSSATQSSATQHSATPHSATQHSTAQTEVLLPVAGMECAACAVRIEKQLAKRSDVSLAQVNLANNQARVAYDGQQASIKDLIQTVERTGFSIPQTVSVLPLTADAVSLERLRAALGDIPGLLDITLTNQPEGKEVTVTHIAELFPVEEINRKLAAQGLTSLKGDVSPDAAEEAAGTSHYVRLRNRFIIAALLSLPVVVISMSHEAITFTGVNYWMFALTTPVVLWAGWPFFASAFRLLRYRAADMNSLIALGVGAAYAYSTATTFWPAQFMAETGRHPDVYFEAAAVIITLVLLGRLLEARAKQKTNASLAQLLALQPPLLWLWMATPKQQCLLRRLPLVCGYSCARASTSR